LTEDNRTVGTLIPTPPKQPEVPSTAAQQGKP
jgi:hypothetical protein